MSDATLLRRYTFKLYPTRAQDEAMHARRAAHCALYNAALQQRIEAYRRRGVTLGLYGQQREVPALRAALPELATISVTELRGTLARVDLAMKAFFRRAKAGAGRASGFPRFKASALYPGWTLADKAGWTFETRDEGVRHGRLRLFGLGWIRARGLLPQAGQPRSVDVLWRDNAWWASVVFAMPPRRAAGDAATRVTFDLITNFATVEAVAQGGGARPGLRAESFAR